MTVLLCCHLVLSTLKTEFYLSIGKDVRWTFATLSRLPCVKGAGVRWTPLPQAEAPTEPAGETLSAIAD